jgi:hypothetical protein
MGANETFMTSKLRRSKALSVVLVVLFTLSTMSLPACSDNDNNTTSQRVVHATVYFDDEGPAATAWVQDGDQNFFFDAVLTINNRPFELIYLGGEESDEDSVPIYHLELYDLAGGDSLTFEAKRSDGTLIYTPPTAEIPMPLELVEPELDQTIIPGEEVIVRWTGGEGGSHIAAFYADDSGEEQYLNVQKYGDVESITIPSEVIKEDGGIIGVAALSGSHSLFRENTSAAPQVESTFVVHRKAARFIPDQRNLEGLSAGCPAGQKKGVIGCCPDEPMPKAAAIAVCAAEFVAIVGIFIWGIRCQRDEPPCKFTGGHAEYCSQYSFTYSHLHWQRGCICPHAWKPPF